MKKAAETNSNLDGLVKLALEMGAIEAKLIDANDVVVADWVRLKCQYGCGAYGKALTCPPYSPTPQQMRQILAGYSKAVLMHVPDESAATQNMVANLERSAFLQGHYRAFGVALGPCQRCEKCNLQHCTKPRLARPSMEACGIDVYATARKNGFTIEVRKSEDEKPTYFSMLLVE
jgi:predicted metal-binding protein